MKELVDEKKVEPIRVCLIQKIIEKVLFRNLATLPGEHENELVTA